MRFSSKRREVKIRRTIILTFNHRVSFIYSSDFRFFIDFIGPRPIGKRSDRLIDIFPVQIERGKYPPAPLGGIIKRSTRMGITVPGR